MCFGSAPQPPKIEYVGPSQDEIAANKAALDQYKTQMQEQQAAFQASLQQQIDAANAETAKLQQQYESDAAAAASQAAAQQAGAYAATASQSEAPATAQTTAATGKKKEKPQGTLKIAMNSTPSTSGAGLNIGV